MKLFVPVEGRFDTKKKEARLVILVQYSYHVFVQFHFLQLVDNISKTGMILNDMCVVSLMRNGRSGDQHF